MVRINLLGDRKDNRKAHALQCLAFMATVVLSCATCFMFQLQGTQQVDILQKEKASLEAELTRLEKITKEVADLEKRKHTLNERIITIANLRAKKHGPVHVLDDLNMAVPDRSWLTAIKDKGGSLEITGTALDDQTVAQFMKKLDESKFYGTIDLVLSKQQDVEGVKLKQFTVLAQTKNPYMKELPKDTKSVVPAAAVAKGNPAPKKKGEKGKGDKADI